MPDLVLVASAVNESEAAMISAQLIEADIPSVTRGPILPGVYVAGACDVLVEEHDAQRAREVLAEPPFSDEELSELSDEAGRELGNPPSGT